MEEQQQQRAGAKRKAGDPGPVVLARAGGLVLTHRRGPGDDAEEFTVEREARRPGLLLRSPLAVAAALATVVAVAAAPPCWRWWRAALGALALAALALSTSALLAVTSESLTVVRGVGVALETRRGRWAALLRALGGVGGGGGGGGGGGARAGAGSGGGGGGGNHTGDVGVHREFLDVERVRSAVVNEHVTTTGVRFYMALVVYNRPDMAVAFPHLMPRLEILIPVYRRVHFLLTGEGGDGLSGEAAAATAPPSSSSPDRTNNG